MAQGRYKPDATRRVVLVGAGHAHLYALRRAAEITRRGFELVVIAPEDFWYSGLAASLPAPIRRCSTVSTSPGCCAVPAPG